MNGHAASDGPKRKSWSKHDLRDVRPLTPTQHDMFHAFLSGKNICAQGTAGTGKTFVALFLALNEILQHHTFDRIIIVRSAVPSREVGFLPGTLEEKIAVYEQPYIALFQELLGRSSSYQDMKDVGTVEFVTTSFLRGLTWDNAIVVVDERQNMTFEELNTIMTRIGEHSRVIVVGDMAQPDLHQQRNRTDTTGMERFLRIVGRMSEFETVKFTRHDIVRGPLVKSWIVACEDDES
jgi:phosphate starvation-inducible protein PhoH